jgi:hypothetical protein
MDYKVDEADMYELRIKIAWLQYRLASASMNLCSDYGRLSATNLAYFDKVFQDVEDLKTIVRVIKDRTDRKKITTCFDETEAA